MKRVIELKVVMQVDVPDHFTEEQAQFYLEENHCMTNHVDRLAEAIAADNEKHICNLCPFAAVTLYGPGAPLDDAFDPERKPKEPGRRR